MCPKLHLKAQPSGALFIPAICWGLASQLLGEQHSMVSSNRFRCMGSNLPAGTRGGQGGEEGHRGS